MTADLSALIARLEAAEVGSRELDKEILAAFGFTWRGMAYWNCEDEMWSGPSALTRSLEAALALAERTGVRRLWNLWKSNSGYVASFEGDIYSRSSTPALALCIAVLRAKQGEGE